MRVSRDVFIYFAPQILQTVEWLIHVHTVRALPNNLTFRELTWVVHEFFVLLVIIFIAVGSILNGIARLEALAVFSHIIGCLNKVPWRSGFGNRSRLRRDCFSQGLSDRRRASHLATLGVAQDRSQRQGFRSVVHLHHLRPVFGEVLEAVLIIRMNRSRIQHLLIPPPVFLGIEEPKIIVDRRHGSLIRLNLLIYIRLVFYLNFLLVFLNHSVDKVIFRNLVRSGTWLNFISWDEHVFWGNDDFVGLGREMGETIAHYVLADLLFLDLFKELGDHWAIFHVEICLDFLYGVNEVLILAVLEYPRRKTVREDILLISLPTTRFQRFIWVHLEL